VGLAVIAAGVVAYFVSAAIARRSRVTASRASGMREVR
jgi:hypothetical protein